MSKEKHHEHKHNCNCGCHENKNNCEKHESECNCDENCDCETEEVSADTGYQTNLETKVLEYIQTAQRLQAEFDNYRKRATEQIAQARFDGMIDAISKFVPVLDSFANAEKMISDPKLLEGYNLIKNQIETAFKTLGVEKIEAKNTFFDPKFHNALAVQNKTELDNDIIIDEYQAGYKLNDKIIRYSQVIVNKKEE